MRPTALLIAAALRIVAAETALTPADAVAAFAHAHLVPGVVPKFAPTAALHVTFADPATNTTLALVPGANLTAAQVAHAPQFGLGMPGDTPSGTYVVALFDADAPAPANASTAPPRLFLGGGFIPAPSILAGVPATLVNTTPALTEYSAPAPPTGSAPHRFTFLVYEEPTGFAVLAPLLVGTAAGLNVTMLAEVLGLGAPVAGSVFLLGPDAANGTAGGDEASGGVRSAAASGDAGRATGSGGAGSGTASASAAIGSAMGGTAVVNATGAVVTFGGPRSTAGAPSDSGGAVPSRASSSNAMSWYRVTGDRILCSMLCVWLGTAVGTW